MGIAKGSFSYLVLQSEGHEAMLDDWILKWLIHVCEI